VPRNALVRSLGPALGLVGGLLGVVTLVDAGLRLVGRLPVTVPFFAGLLTSAPFVALLLLGGVRLHRNEVSAERYPRIAGWTVASTVFFGAFFLLVAAFFFETFWNRLGVVRWGLAVGTGGGFLIGYTNARSIDRAVAAERSAIRAEQTEQRRELLAYLHALLRHEVLNAVTAIEGNASLLDRTVEDETARERTAVIERQCRGLASVIEDVRFLLDATEHTESPHAVPLASVLRTELEGLTDRYGGVETETDLTEPLAVEADGLVGRLFGNLLENAVEHNDSAPPEVSVTGRRVDGAVTIVVQDNGPGLPESVRKNPLEPSVDKRADHGLGFAIVHLLVDRYDGDLDVAVPDDGGTRIVVTLPAGDPAAARADDRESQLNPTTGTPN
jgi:signal transduction histidine kinase